jgi:hypothetical protein
MAPVGTHPSGTPQNHLCRLLTGRYPDSFWLWLRLHPREPDEPGVTSAEERVAQEQVPALAGALDSDEQVQP